jgi:hypothetical protein
MKKISAGFKKIGLRSLSMVTVPSKSQGQSKVCSCRANNYYAGFGPATANLFRRMVGLEEIVCEEI